jgi:hypothetical protein
MKASETILMFLMAGLMLPGCKTRSDVNPAIVTIDLNEALKTNGELKLSDLVSEVEIVKFDTIKDAYFSGLQTAVIGKKFILISAGDPKQLLLFNRQGGFIRLIGRRGQGPGEYLNAKISSTDPNEKFVFVADYYSDRIIKYDIEGNLIKQVKISQNTPAKIIDGIKFIDETHFTLLTRRSSGQTDEYCSVITFDLDLNLTSKSLKRPNDDNLLLINLLYNYLDYLPDGLAFWETYLDTVYHIYPDGTAMPAFRFIIENSGLKPEYFKDMMLLSKHTRDITMIHSIAEFPHYITALGRNKGKPFELVYDKKTEKAFTLDHLASCDTTPRRRSSIFNDLFGIEPISYKSFDFGCKHLIFPFYPGYYKMTNDLDRLSKMTVSQPDLRDELVEIIEEAYEDDMVLIIMKIRD